LRLPPLFSLANLLSLQPPLQALLNPDDFPIPFKLYLVPFLIISISGKLSPVFEMNNIRRKTDQRVKENADAKDGYNRPFHNASDAAHCQKALEKIPQNT